MPTDLPRAPALAGIAIAIPSPREAAGQDTLRPMLKVTQDLVLPTAITGSYPRPLWFTESLGGRSFKAALGDSLFREQYLDAVACIVNAQEAAGLDIVTDGDSRFDLVVGGKSWFF
jgi:5-methyltetrahydropteroyltriglutamate--homocysteine methyltransferase